MYVVGASKLSEFWKAHPHCEAELRALHALLGDAVPGGLGALLGDGRADGDGVTIQLSHTRVSMDINEPARVVSIRRVEMREGD